MDFQSVESAVDQFLKNTFPAVRDSLGEDFFVRGAYPRIDIKRYKDNTKLFYELPHWVDKEDISIELKDDAITVAGPGSDNIKDDGGEFIYKEIKNSSFKRTVIVPKEYDASKASAEFKNSLLIVTIPLAESQKKKTIKIH